MSLLANPTLNSCKLFILHFYSSLLLRSPGGFAVRHPWELTSSEAGHHNPVISNLTSGNFISFLRFSAEIFFTVKERKWFSHKTTPNVSSTLYILFLILSHSPTPKSRNMTLGQPSFFLFSLYFLIFLCFQSLCMQKEGSQVWANLSVLTGKWRRADLCCPSFATSRITKSYPVEKGCFSKIVDTSKLWMMVPPWKLVFLLFSEYVWKRITISQVIKDLD